MPCWTMETVPVEFELKNKDLILSVIKNRLGIKWCREYGDEIRVDDKVFINLKDKSAQVRNGEYGLLNQIKRAYSQEVIEQIAKKRKWAIKKTKDNTFRLRRY